MDRSRLGKRSGEKTSMMYEMSFDYDKKHMVMLLGRKAICPECSGVLNMVGEDRM
jgi:hypothetical protein